MILIEHKSLKKRCFYVMVVVLVFSALFIKAAVDDAWVAYQISQYDSFQICSDCAGPKSFLYYQNSGIGVLNISAFANGTGQAFEVLGNGENGVIWGTSYIFTYNSGENRHFRSTIYISAADHLTEETTLNLCDNCRTILLSNSQYSVIIADFTNKRFYPIKSGDHVITINDYIIEVTWGRENYVYLDATYQFRKPTGIIDYIKTLHNLSKPVY